MIATLRAQRRPPMLLAIYVTSVLVFFGTHLDLYLEKVNQLPTNPIYAFLVPSLMLFAWYVITDAGAASFYRLITATASSSVALICFVSWIAVHVLHLAEWPAEANADFTVFFPIYQFLVLLFGLALGSAVGFERVLRPAAAVAAITLAATIVWDALAPGTFSVDAGRPAGFAMNANVAGFDLLLLAVAGVAYDRFRPFDALLLASALCAIIFTFSRGGLILFGVVAVFYIAAVWCSDRSGATARRVIALGACFGIGLLVTFAVLKETLISSQPEAAHRLDLFEDRNLIENGRESRIDLFFHYLAIAAQQPVRGHGTGAVLSLEHEAPWREGPHNMYLRVWVDHGIWGLASYTGLLAAIAMLFIRYRCWAGLAITMLTFLNGAFSHNVIEDKTLLILAGALLASATAQPVLEPRT